MEQQNKMIPVFSQNTAARLMAEGFVVDHMDNNYKKTNQKVFYFRYCPGIYDVLNENSRKKEVRRNAR